MKTLNIKEGEDELRVCVEILEEVMQDGEDNFDSAEAIAQVEAKIGNALVREKRFFFKLIYRAILNIFM